MATPPQVVDAFYRMAATEDIQEKHSLVTLSPWPSNSEPPPSKVLVLDCMDEEQILVALDGTDLVIAGSTFSTDEEIEYARKYLPVLCKMSSKNPHPCIVLFQLTTPGMNTNRTSMDRHLERLDSIMGLCMDEMVFLPELKPHLFHQNLRMALMTWKSNIERVKEMLSQEMSCPSEEEIKELERHHKMLLWHDIPSALMPKFFTKIDNSLVQSSTNIGKYAWTEALRQNCSYAGAKDEFGKCVTIRVIDKGSIFTADDLEGIFREHRFLSDVLDHPNLPKCIDMLHGPENMYFIFGGASLPSMGELLKSMDGKRTSSAIALQVFSKLTETLVYIHSQSCVHRNVSVRSVHVRLEDNDTVSSFKLFDFEKAVQVRSGQSTRAACGVFPEMAPEMVQGAPYVPHLADCWSAGVVLIEMAGGLGCLHASLHDNFRGEPTTSLMLMEDFFLTANCHERALTCLGAPPNDDINRYLQRTLQPRPEHRREMGDVHKE